MCYPLRRRSVLTAVLSLAAVAAVGCTGASHGVEGAGDGPASPVAGAASEPGAGAVEKQILIDNFTFNPATLTVPVGTKVTWVNHDDVPHTATSTAKPKTFASKTLDTDDKFSHVFTASGTYEYFCAVHPKMTGKIIVK